MIARIRIAFLFFAFVGLALQGFSLAAQGIENIDSKVIVKFAGKPTTLPVLKQWLKANTKTDEEYCRAAFVFLASQIDYNMAAFEQGIQIDIAPEVVLKSQNSICEGYANLYKVLCEAKGINCFMVIGHGEGLAIARNQPFDNHAWNCVYLNGTWQLVEATWAGLLYRQGGLAAIQGKDFNRFWLANPKQFLVEHFPNYPDFKLLNPPLAVGTFLKGKEKFMPEVEKLALMGERQIKEINTLFALDEYSQNLQIAEKAYEANPENPLPLAFAIMNNTGHNYNGNLLKPNKTNLDTCISIEKKALEQYERSYQLLELIKNKDEIVKRNLETALFNIKKIKKYTADLENLKAFYLKQGR